MKKKIYMALSADVLHHGHINLINKAQKYGDIIFGLLTDKAISERKKVPYLTFEQRKKIIQNIKGIDTISRTSYL